MEKQIIATLENFIKQATDIPQEIGMWSQNYEDYIREENPKTKKDKFNVLIKYVEFLESKDTIPSALLVPCDFQVGSFSFSCDIYRAIELLKNSHKFKAASPTHRKKRSTDLDYRSLRLQDSINELKARYDGERKSLFKRNNNHISPSDMIDECWGYISNK